MLASLADPYTQPLGQFVNGQRIKQDGGAIPRVHWCATVAVNRSPAYAGLLYVGFSLVTDGHVFMQSKDLELD